ncbi:MAG: indolepyruvate ferredoxin oxidoreductase family protein [Xanthobacteraceae bacterium]
MTVAALQDVSLDDKYVKPSGRVYLSGIQALVRLPLLQRTRDRAAGLNTGGFISGYRGSPLGMYDSALWGAKAHLAAENIQFQPGLNEDLAATSVWGSQQVGMFPGATVQGVFGIWYGKGPGVDRSADALKHANAAGSSRYGGVLALAGDDHGCQSSTLAHQSEQIFQAAMIPILNPATVQEYLDFGIYGFALSRYSGCWIGFKAISETAESSASITVDPQRMQFVDPAFEMPPGGLHIRWPDPPLEAERRLHGPKMQAVAAFARANRIDRVVLDSPAPRLGILTTGKAYLDVRQALADLGLSEDACRAMGLRIYKVGLVWPLEVEGARRFADRLKDVLVVEEKHGFIENQFVHALYNMDASRRPSVVGKRDEQGAPLLPSEGELSPTLVARAILSRLERMGGGNPQLAQRLARLESFERVAMTPQIKSQRAPFFCSGCPHNTSTQVPDGSRAMAGIGCHGMATWMPNRNTQTITHMGGEGTNWIGQAAFTTEKHVFQNLGDGTYTHSGLLAIRAAAAAGVNITYKILYNDAVAMTGGQTAESGFTVPQIASQMVAEGAKRVVVVSDEPNKYPDMSLFPRGVTTHDRKDLDTIQRQLRETKGLTVLIYDQTCAAEKRRRRKRGLFPDPPKRVFINDAVCEGCGDCSVKSNCVSVKPLETELGRKRTIDQSSCNKDFSCVEGFCPSFVTVHGGGVRKAAKPGAAAGQGTFGDIPMPAERALHEPFNILMTGIGGTGVITVGALLGMAAHLEGKGCSVLDFTGLAQKNGGVMTHVRIAPTPEDIAAVRIAAGGADLLLGFDIVGAASPVALARIEQGVSRAVINTSLTPTAAFVTDGNIDFEAGLMNRILRDAVGEKGVDFVQATRIATAIMGDSISTNLLLLGYVFQKGLLPLSFEAIDRAIELNGSAVEANRRAFAWGRLAAHDPAAIEKAVAGRATPEAREMSLPERIKFNADILTRYQDAAYARKYADIVSRVQAAEASRAPGLRGLTDAAVRGLFKLMAYKDEYEVARLYTDGDFRAKLERQFEGEFKLQFYLAPPILAKKDPVTGHLRKRAYGPWVFSVFKLLARLRGLRGTAFDIFGYTAERRMERELVTDYIALIDDLTARLSPRNHSLAVELLRLPESIRGFGHVKEKSVRAARERKSALLAALDSNVAVAAE